MNSTEMNPSEAAFSGWLTRQGCPWVFIDQASGDSADGALRARPRRPFHRPDFLALMDGIGTIAIDVKFYALRSRVVELSRETHNSPSEQHTIGYVKLAWSEIEALHEFQKVSNIPAWICLFFEADAGDIGCLYRVDMIYDAYAPIFVAQDRGIWDKDQSPFEWFDGWPIERQIDLTLPTKELVFDFPIDDDSADFNNAADARAFAAVNVPPIVLRLSDDGSITELISFSRSEVANQPATEAAKRYVENIARALNTPLPPDLDRLRCSNFIARYKSRFKGMQPSK